MKKKNADVIYLTRAEWDAFKREEAEERMELVRRVERGEITAEEATNEASVFKGPIPSITEQPIDFREVLQKLKGLHSRKRLHGRRHAKTIHA